MSSSMTRLLMIAGGIFAVCFGLFVVGSRMYDGYNEQQQQLANLETEELNLTSRLVKLEKSKKEVDKWQAISLPGNVQVSALLYKNFLQEMLLRHRFVIRTFTEPGRGATTNTRQGPPVTTNINYDVVVEGTLAQLISFLKEFYTVNVPHVIKNIIVEPLGKGGDAKLSVTLKIDAMSMSTTKIRQSVIASPPSTTVILETLAAWKRVPIGLVVGLNQLTGTGYLGVNKLASQDKPERDYAVMQRKSVFAGLAPANAVAKETPVLKQPDMEILKYTQLTSITANNITEEGLLRIRKTEKYVKMRAEGGVNSFEIRDGEGQLVLKGKVLAIKPRDLVFETSGKAYALHIGQTMEDAMKKELTPDELKKFDAELTAADQ
jgi:hypothetical protein